MPAVKDALAANASKFESPASSRKIVLIPQISDAANVFPRSSTKYVRWIWAGLGIDHVHLTDAFPAPAAPRSRRGGLAALAHRGTRPRWTRRVQPLSSRARG